MNLLRITFLPIVIGMLSGCIGIEYIHPKLFTYGDASAMQGATRAVLEKEQRKWTGVIVSAIVPLPILIPYGHETETTWVKDGKIIYSEKVETGTAIGVGCVMLVICEPEGLWGPVIFQGAHFM